MTSIQCWFNSYSTGASKAALDLRLWGVHGRGTMPNVLCRMEHTKRQASKKISWWQEAGNRPKLETRTICTRQTFWIMTDNANVLKPAISPKLRVARFTSTWWQSYDLHEIKLTQKEALLGQRYFSFSMPLLTPTHSFKTCSGNVTKFSTSRHFIWHFSSKQAWRYFNCGSVALKKHGGWCSNCWAVSGVKTNNVPSSSSVLKNYNSKYNICIVVNRFSQNENCVSKATEYISI